MCWQVCDQVERQKCRDIPREICDQVNNRNDGDDDDAVVNSDEEKDVWWIFPPRFPAQSAGVFRVKFVTRYIQSSFSSFSSLFYYH